MQNIPCMMQKVITKLELCLNTGRKWGEVGEEEEKEEDEEEKEEDNAEEKEEDDEEEKEEGSGRRNGS